MPEIIIVSDAVEGTFVNLDGVDRTEMRKEDKILKCALLNSSTWSTEKEAK